MSNRLAGPWRIAEFKSLVQSSCTSQGAEFQNSIWKYGSYLYKVWKHLNISTLIPTNTLESTEANKGKKEKMEGKTPKGIRLTHHDDGCLWMMPKGKSDGSEKRMGKLQTCGFSRNQQIFLQDKGVPVFFWWRKENTEGIRQRETTQIFTREGRITAITERKWWAYPFLGGGYLMVVCHFHHYCSSSHCDILWIAKDYLYKD